MPAAAHESVLPTGASRHSLQAGGKFGVVAGFPTIRLAIRARGSTGIAPRASPGGGIDDPRTRVMPHGRRFQGVDDQREIRVVDLQRYDSSLTWGGPYRFKSAAGIRN